MRLTITLAVVAVLAIAGFAIAARGGEDKKVTKGTDLTAIRCPLVSSGEDQDGVEQYKPAKDAFNTAELIGLSLADAQAKAAEHTCEIIISVKDGKGLPVSIDLNPKAIFVYTEKDVVTTIEGVGGGI